MFEWLKHNVLSREDAEFIFFVAQSSILAIALWALMYTRGQLREAEKNSQIIAHQALANSLLNLEQRWNSEQIRETRICINEFSRQLKAEVFQEHAQLRDEAALEKVQEKFTAELLRLQKEDSQKYIVLMRILGFFETVGLLVKRKYIELEDVDLLLRGPIVEFGLFYTPHIKVRAQEKGVPPGLGVNALFLVDEINKRLARR
jgi:hypothetical protein